MAVDPLENLRRVPNFPAVTSVQGPSSTWMKPARQLVVKWLGRAGSLADWFTNNSEAKEEYLALVSAGATDPAAVRQAVLDYKDPAKPGTTWAATKSLMKTALAAFVGTEPVPAAPGQDTHADEVTRALDFAKQDAAVLVRGDKMILTEGLHDMIAKLENWSVDNFASFLQGMDSAAAAPTDVTEGRRRAKGILAMALVNIGSTALPAESSVCNVCNSVVHIKDMVFIEGIPGWCKVGCDDNLKAKVEVFSIVLDDDHTLLLEKAKACCLMNNDVSPALVRAIKGVSKSTSPKHKRSGKKKKEKAEEGDNTSGESSSSEDDDGDDLRNAKSRKMDERKTERNKYQYNAARLENRLSKEEVAEAMRLNAVTVPEQGEMARQMGTSLFELRTMARKSDTRTLAFNTSAKASSLASIVAGVASGNLPVDALRNAEMTLLAMAQRNALAVELGGKAVLEIGRMLNPDSRAQRVAEAFGIVQSKAPKPPKLAAIQAAIETAVSGAARGRGNGGGGKGGGGGGRDRAHPGKPQPGQHWCKGCEQWAFHAIERCNPKLKGKGKGGHKKK